MRVRFTVLVILMTHSQACTEDCRVPSEACPGTVDPGTCGCVLPVDASIDAPDGAPVDASIDAPDGASVDAPDDAPIDACVNAQADAQDKGADAPPEARAPDGQIASDSAPTKEED